MGMADESLPGCAAKVAGAAEPSVLRIALAKGQSENGPEGDEPDSQRM